MVSKQILENCVKQLEDIIHKMEKHPNNIESIELSHQKPMKPDFLGIAMYTGRQEFNFNVKFLFSTGAPSLIGGVSE